MLLSGVLLLDQLGWHEAAVLVNKGLEATFAESEETAKKGPGGKLYVTYDIARQFTGYGEESGGVEFPSSASGSFTIFKANETRWRSRPSLVGEAVFRVPSE